MKEGKEYFKKLKEIIDSDLTEFKRDQKLIDFVFEMKNDAIIYADKRIDQLIENLNK